MAYRYKWIFLVICLTACNELEQNKYYPPLEGPIKENTVTLDKNFNTIWPELILLTQNNANAIVKEQNGLIVAELVLPEVSKYIDCGMMNDEIYVDYIHRIFESSLTAKVYIELKEVNSATSNIKINTAFTFISLESGTTWNFNTNEPAIIWVANPAEGALPQRICISKNTLEANFIKKIRSL